MRTSPKRILIDAWREGIKQSTRTLLSFNDKNPTVETGLSMHFPGVYCAPQAAGLCAFVAMVILIYTTADLFCRAKTFGKVLSWPLRHTGKSKDYMRPLVKLERCFLCPPVLTKEYRIFRLYLTTKKFRIELFATKNCLAFIIWQSPSAGKRTTFKIREAKKQKSYLQWRDAGQDECRRGYVQDSLHSG